MTMQHDGWVAAAAGDGGDLSRWQPGPPVADPVKEYAAAAGRVLAAFGADGVLEREFALAELSPVLRFPAAEAPGAVKIGEHGRGTVTTGDGRDGIVSPAARDRIRAFVRERLGGLDPAPVGEVTCLYTSTASEDFILDRYGPFIVCSPCSGHGAKFAPLVGDIVADLSALVEKPHPDSAGREVS